MTRLLKIALFGTLLAFLGPKLAFADQVSTTKFKGLNTNSNAVIIDPSEAQDELNVNVSITGNSIQKRSGYGLYKALSSGQAVHGGYHFFDSSGNDVQVWGSSTSLFSIVQGAAPTQMVSSATLNSTWDCVDSQQNAYCVDSNRDAYIKTNGATMSWYTAPLGNIVEATPDRIVVAGVSSNPNTIFVSGSNNFINYTVGVNSIDPFNEIIAAPGSHITHLRWGCGKLLWWKDSSFGWMDFDDQFTVSLKTISDYIGTFDNTSAIDPGGNVWFRGQDGHTWRYDCSGLEKMSIDITPNVQVSGNRTANLWAQTSASDFNNGARVYTDTTTTSGSVILTGRSDEFTSFAANWSIDSGSFTASTSDVIVSSKIAGVTSSIRSVMPNPLFNHWYSAMSYKNNNLSLNNESSGGDVTLCIVSISSTGYCVESNDINYVPNHGVALLRMDAVNSTGVIAAAVNVGTVDTTYHTLSMSLNTNGAMVGYIDGVPGPSVTDTNYTGPFKQIVIFGSPVVSTQTFSIDWVKVYAASGTYFSAIKNAPAINGWSNFSANAANGGGTHSFYVRASTANFIVTGTTLPWTVQGNGAIPTISTGTYFQVADTFTITAATQTPTLSDFTFNWFEGTATDQSYMIWFDNAIWETVAYGAGQSVNNYIFRYDLINQGWVLYNFGAGGFLVQRNVLYFGDTAAGNVYNFGTATSDNGTAINAYWKSKQFTGTDTFNQNALNQIDVIAKKDAGSTLTSTYITDALTSTSYSISLSTGGTVAQSRKLLPSGKLGYTFSLQLGDTSASSAWEVLGYRILFTPQVYRPTSP